MRPQHNRLPSDAPRGFAGGVIDRSKPLQFRLDGRVISGFAGDTVLSAVLASGIDTLGRHRGHAIGLTSRSAPAVLHASQSNRPDHALSMARTPAVGGVELVTFGAPRGGGLGRLFQPGRTLGLPLDEPHCLDQPWRASSSEVTSGHDLIVVGGGVAGLSAALAGARAGLGVTLVEARPHLGGHSGLFGTQDGEDTPEASMSRLREEVLASDAVSVLTSAHAFSIRQGRVRVHHVTFEDGKAQGKVMDLDAPRIVLATGALERLPVFAGNRLPGVLGALEAYELATCYGIWSGGSALVSTVSNPAYRLAMLASDAGIAIPRILDGRSSPASRFIEFSRAYGIVQVLGTVPALATLGRAGGSITVNTDAGVELAADRLIACGGWQPDLTLWHIAGGTSQWSTARHRLQAEGDLNGIVLAGSAAGYFTRRGCIASGTDAIDILLRRDRKPAADTLIDTLYETPDAASPVAAVQDGAEGYLDGGEQLLARPLPSSSLWEKLFRPSRASGGMTALSEAPQPLAICEVAAGVDLDLIPPDAAGIVAQERVALVPLVSQVSAPEEAALPAPAPDHVPAYLASRFGPDARVVQLRPEQERRFEPGALVYRSSDIDQPLLAVGVVLRQVEGKTLALVAKPAIRAGLPLSIRDHGRANIAHVVAEKA